MPLVGVKGDQIVKRWQTVSFQDDVLRSRGIDPQRAECALIPGIDLGKSFEDFSVVMCYQFGGKEDRVELAFVRAGINGHKAFIEKLWVGKDPRISIIGLEQVHKKWRKRIGRRLVEAGMDLIELAGRRRATVTRYDQLRREGPEAIRLLAQERGGIEQRRHRRFLPVEALARKIGCSKRELHDFKRNHPDEWKEWDEQYRKMRLNRS
jgi:hypothetical protein